MYSCRVVWALMYAGVKDVRMLDGGFDLKTGSNLMVRYQVFQESHLKLSILIKIESTIANFWLQQMMLKIQLLSIIQL